MEATNSMTPCRLAEWYRTDLTDEAAGAMVTALQSAAEAASGPITMVRLVVAVFVPSDEVFYGLFVATSTEAIIDACARAALPADRLTSDVGAWIRR